MTVTQPEVDTAAWITEVDGRVLLTTPASTLSLAELPREMAAEKAAANNKLIWVSGKFVEADQPNVNGAYWTAADLEYGERTILHAPLNYLHRARHVIGAFTDSRFYRPGDQAMGEAAASVQRPFIGATACIWAEFFPHEARICEIASNARTLFYSMECQSQTVRCETAAGGGRWVGCDAEYPFERVYYQPDTVCEHLRQRTSQRRFKQPRFNAGAVIVPPVRPAWSGASAEIRVMADKLAEQTFAEAASSRGYDDATLVSLMERIVSFARS